MILKSERKGRKGDDAVFGPGTYLTSLKPENRTKHEIALNNYGSNGQNLLDKVAYWFEFDIPDSQVKNFSDKRDVWLLESKDLVFKDYKPTDQGDFNSYKSVKMNCEELEVIKNIFEMGDAADAKTAALAFAQVMFNMNERKKLAMEKEKEK